MTIVVGVKTKMQIVSRETACPNSRSTRSNFGYLVNFVFLSIILHEFSLGFSYMMTILYDKCTIMSWLKWFLMIAAVFLRFMEFFLFFVV